MLNKLIDTLHTWQADCIARPTGLKEPMAYQRVIDECRSMLTNKEIQDRIMREDGNVKMQP